MPVDLFEYAGDIITFTCEDEEIHVIPRCPECQRFIKAGKVLENGLGHIRFEEWNCSNGHNDVEPEWYRGV